MIDGKQAFRILFFKGNRQQGEARTQAIRFPKDKWTAEQATKWCREKSGSFEKAEPKELNISQIKELASDPLKIQESFKWVPDMDKVRTLSKQAKGRFLKIVALHPIVTDRKDEGHGSRKFTDDELKRSARTLANTLPNLLHKVKMVHGQNLVMDAEEEEGRLETLVYLEDHEILKGIRERIIDKVSVQGNAREAPEVCRQGTCAKEPKGIIYNGLAFVNSKQPFTYNGTTYPPAPPGDIRTSIEILETITSPNSNSSLSSVNSSKTQMDFTDELGKQILAPMMKIAENLENVVDAINKTDAPGDFKEKLIALAKQLYAEQKPPPPPPTETKTDPAVLKRLEQTETAVKGIDDIKKIVEELKSRDDKKLEELFNKVLTDKLEPLQKQITEVKVSPPPGKDIKPIEALTEKQIGGALVEKIRSESLSEIMERHAKVIG